MNGGQAWRRLSSDDDADEEDIMHYEDVLSGLIV